MYSLVVLTTNGQCFTDKHLFLNIITFITTHVNLVTKTDEIQCKY